MALHNLWYVTHTLTSLIRAVVNNELKSKDYKNLVSVTVSARPPDQLKDSTKTLGFYLYHIAENTYFKNLPSTNSDMPPVRYTPMGLDLYFQLTAHDEGNEAGIEKMHLMMGLAIKALHDYPVIDDSTKIFNPQTQKDIPVLNSNLKDSDTVLKITLQPMSHNEAVSFWTAGSSPLQVAAYYQVSVVLMEPEEPQTRVGRVLTYGTYVQVSGTPHLDGSQNVIEFTDPAENKNEIELRPAQAPPAKAAPVLVASAPMESQVTFNGTNLVGDQTTLILKNRLWDEPIEVKDDSWFVRATENQVTAVICEDVGGKKVLPGIYTAMVKVTNVHELPDGKKKEFYHTSNETPFVVSPRIDTNTEPNAQSLIKVDGFIFKYEVTDPQTGQKENLVSLQVYVGDVRLRLRQGKNVANLNPGEFSIHESPPPKAPQLHLRLPLSKDLPPPVINDKGKKNQPIRILVNGAESPPKWIIVP